MDIYKRISENLKDNKRIALATVISAKGSTPRDAAAKMIINEDGSIEGTIGGGLVEKKVIEKALESLEENIKTTKVDYILDNEKENGIEMVCGGNMEVFIEVLNPDPVMLLLGGGHVSSAVGCLANFLNFKVTVVDERKEFANKERFPYAQKIINKDFEPAIDEVDINELTHIVIATKDADERCLYKVIESNASYIGFLGSRRKIKKIYENLSNKGIKEKLFEKVFAPIGLDINSDTPEEIAISIMAEIIKSQRGGTGKSLSERDEKQ